jgi:hypothetical protein
MHAMHASCTRQVGRLRAGATALPPAEGVEWADKDERHTSLELVKRTLDLEYQIHATHVRRPVPRPAWPAATAAAAPVRPACWLAASSGRKARRLEGRSNAPLRGARRR